MSRHLTLSDRESIAASLNQRVSFNRIAECMGRSSSTISREVRKHRTFVDKGAPYRPINRCTKRYECKRYGICEDKPDCTRRCSTCYRCNSVCLSFAEEKCPHLESAPYVCNGCHERHKCVLKKAYYGPEDAQKEYRKLLTSAREGYNITPSELQNIDRQISPLIKNGHSIHHAFLVAGEAVTVSESTVSRLIKDRQLTATVLDQQRVVKLKLRKKPRPSKKVDRHCRVGRTLEDYKVFRQAFPLMPVVEMDTVIGEVGGKCMLTLIFPSSELMLAFLCDCHTAACVEAKINALYDGLGAIFHSLFPVLLADNGGEFSNPTAIEQTTDGVPRTKVFYCDPNASWQKPHVERNHEFIRMFRPQGSSFDDLTQEKVGLMMSHINSYARESLGDKSPFDVFAYQHGEEPLRRLLHLACQTRIEPKNIILRPSLLR